MNAVAQAWRYLDLSNARDLDAIFRLFADDATYRSSQVGEYAGRAAIEGMMRDVFGRYPDAHWEVEEVTSLPDGGAEFDFRMTAGGGVERHGHEKLWFDAAGRIRRVEVEVTPPAGG